MPKSNYLEEAQLNWVRGTAMPAAPSAVYVALSTADPTEDGSAIAEPAGGDGYARQAATFGAPSQGANAATISNSAEVSFGAATGAWGTITHFAVFDAVSGGNMLYHGTLTASRVVGSGDTARFAAGQLVIGEQ